MTKKTKFDWECERHAQDLAAERADRLVQRLCLSPPIDPLAICKEERRFLRAGGEDFKNSFDGKLKYVGEKKLFLLFYNTKYDASMPPGKHHPRTRFSIAHELGHYFIEHHHQHLRRGGQPHESRSEFLNDVLMEREADAFAASLLLPKHLAEPLLDQGELTFDRIERVADKFEVSRISTAFRAVRLSSLPCAVAGLREGKVAWMLPSDKLIEAKCYPQKGEIRAPFAAARWSAFAAGDDDRASADGKLVDWFQTFDREEELIDVEVTQATLPVRVMNTVVVLLTMDEDALFPEEEEEEEEDDIDKEHRDRFGW